MKKRNTSLIDFDYTLFIVPIILSIIGILFIYSACVNADGIVFTQEYIKQIFWVVTGIILLIVVYIIDISRFKDFIPYFYGLFLLVLLYVRFFGKVVKGARSWIGLFGDFGIQPSELMKLITILFLAKFLEDSEHSQEPFKRYLKAVAIIIIPAGFILSQPDFGTALVFIPIFLFMIYIGKIKKTYVNFTLFTAVITIILTILPFWEKYILKTKIPAFSIFYEAPYAYFLIAGSAIICIFAVIGFNMFKKRYYYWIAFVDFIVFISLTISFLAQKVLQEYQIKRLIVFLDPTVDAKGSGWNIIQSMTAIGSGGFWGKGFLGGTQSHYQYLPEQRTDFIFSIISEEIGFIGGFIIFMLFLTIFIRGTTIISSTRSTFGRTVCAGIIGMIFFHFIINIGMAMGIMPITGIPMFFLSYGGSSLWTAMIAIGIMLSINNKRYRY